MPPRITPLILTADEEPNLARVLARLEWAERIVVVDSFSTDATPAIARADRRVTFLQRTFDGHEHQWNYGIDQCPTDWVLALDADYVLSEELVRELTSVPLGSGPVAYYARFRYCIHGRPLRRTLYPPRAVLFDRRECRYRQEGHTQILTIPGPSAFLEGTIAHDDRKPLGRWLRAQERYTELTVRDLLARTGGPMKREDRLRLKIWPVPPLVLAFCLFRQGLIWEGWPGWYLAFQRTLTETMVALRLMDHRLAAQPKAAEHLGERPR